MALHLFLYNPSRKRRLTWTSVLFAAIMITITLTTNFFTYKDLQLRGYPDNFWKAFFSIEALRKSYHTPVMDICANPEPGDILIYYRWGCKDCEAVYLDIAHNVRKQERVFYIETNSENGQELLKDYPVTRVPAIVLIKENGAFHYEDPCKPTQGRTEYNPDALKTLLQEREQFLGKK